MHLTSKEEYRTAREDVISIADSAGRLFRCSVNKIILYEKKKKYKLYDAF